MKWLNFIPLLAWMLGFVALLEWERQFNAKTYTETDDKGPLAAGLFYLGGCLFWLFIGAILCG